jgi:competence protein ComEC
MLQKTNFCRWRQKMIPVEHIMVKGLKGLRFCKIKTSKTIFSPYVQNQSPQIFCINLNLTPFKIKIMTVAEKIIKPTKAGIFRIVFLYTGQGESTLLVIPTGPTVTDYMYVLVDSDRDKEPKEVDLVEMFKDLFKTSGQLSIFLNTHPHNDHFGGIRDIYDEIGFSEVWHSNHKPGGEHKEKFKDFQYVLDKVGKSNEYHLKGTNDLNKVRKSNDTEVIKKLGMVDYQVLSPAEYLCDDIDDEGADERNKRIHEQCGVIKFTYGKEAKGIMITGDSDKEAWEEHITDYHKDNLPSIVLSASHHGSRTFFKDDEDDEDVYERHIEEIKPTYLIISAPEQKNSPHGHPHDDAMELYRKHVEEDGIFHLGDGPYSVIIDIDQHGSIEVKTDTELIEEYGKGNNDDDDNNNGKVSKAVAPYIAVKTSRLDEKPMG